MPTWSAATEGEHAKLGKGPVFLSLLRNEMGARNNGRMKMNWLDVAQTGKFRTMVNQAIIVHRRPGMGCGTRQYTPKPDTKWHFGRMVEVLLDTLDDWLEFKEAQDARPSPRKRADERNAAARLRRGGSGPAPEAKRQFQQLSATQPEAATGSDAFASGSEPPEPPEPPEAKRRQTKVHTPMEPVQVLEAAASVPAASVPAAAAAAQGDTSFQTAYQLLEPGSKEQLKARRSCAHPLHVVWNKGKSRNNTGYIIATKRLAMKATGWCESCAQRVRTGHGPTYSDGAIAAVAAAQRGSAAAAAARRPGIPKNDCSNCCTWMSACHCVGRDSTASSSDMRSSPYTGCPPFRGMRVGDGLDYVVDHGGTGGDAAKAAVRHHVLCGHYIGAVKAGSVVKVKAEQLSGRSGRSTHSSVQVTEAGVMMKEPGDGLNANPFYVATRNLLFNVDRMRKPPFRYLDEWLDESNVARDAIPAELYTAIYDGGFKCRCGCGLSVCTCCGFPLVKKTADAVSANFELRGELKHHVTPMQAGHVNAHGLAICSDSTSTLFGKGKHNVFINFEPVCRPCNLTMGRHPNLFAWTQEVVAALPPRLEVEEDEEWVDMPDRPGWAQRRTAWNAWFVAWEEAGKPELTWCGPTNPTEHKLLV